MALAEMAMASGIGARLVQPDCGAGHAFWFGEDQARYVVTVTKARRGWHTDGGECGGGYSSWGNGGEALIWRTPGRYLLRT